MTKTEALKIAKRARQYGHFNRGYDAASNATIVEVTCPQCQQRVQGYQSQYDPKGNTAPKALDRAMVEHLLEDCEPTSLVEASAPSLSQWRP